MPHALRERSVCEVGSARTHPSTEALGPGPGAGPTPAPMAPQTVTVVAVDSAVTSALSPSSTGSGPPPKPPGRGSSRAGGPARSRPGAGGPQRRVQRGRNSWPVPPKINRLSPPGTAPPPWEGPLQPAGPQPSSQLLEAALARPPAPGPACGGPNAVTRADIRVQGASGSWQLAGSRRFSEKPPRASFSRGCESRGPQQEPREGPPA